MNSTQFNLIANKLIKSDTQIDAVYLHMIRGLSAYAAEIALYKRETCTVKRDAKRITKMFDFCMLVANGEMK